MDKPSRPDVDKEEHWVDTNFNKVDNGLKHRLDALKKALLLCKKMGGKWLPDPPFVGPVDVKA